jgi:hypothetical protein
VISPKALFDFYTRRWWRDIKPETKAKLEVMMAVPPETPLLNGILLVLRGMEEESVQAISHPGIAQDTRTALSGAIATLKTAQERIATIVYDANLRIRK